MVRRQTKKIGYNEQVVRFQAVRNDTCAQIQEFAYLYGLATLSTNHIVELEQHIFTCATKHIPIERVYVSKYCKQYYNHIAYRVVGLSPLQLKACLTNAKSRTLILQTICLHVQTGQPLHIECAAHSPASSVHKEQISKQSAYDEIDALMTKLCTDGSNDLFTPICRTCKTNKEVTFDTKQTRGADEGMTIEFQCETCGAKWSQSK